MHPGSKSWTCILVVAALASASPASATPCRGIAILPGPASVLPEHDRTPGVSLCRPAAVRFLGPASVARGHDGLPASPTASTGPDFRWFLPRMFDAFEGLHFETFDPRTGDYALYATNKKGRPWAALSEIGL